MIEILHDSVDISNLLISYNRQQEMCSGIGMLDMILTDEGREYFPWDSITLYEDGDKKGEYFIVETDNDGNKGIITINAQDSSKKLSDYFVDDQYEVGSPTSARSLITKYLDMAGVSYSFTAGDGVNIGKGATFGLSSVFEIVTTLLQYSGWYMYFDSNNVCIVGTLDTNPGSATLITDTIITYLKVHKNDDMLRNKAVVWGGTEYPDGSMVHVSRQITTPWNYDENDLRAIVISNGNIRDYESANTMANRLMQEFPRLTIEKTINIAGITNLEIGSSVNVDSKWWSGSGLVTTDAASFSASDGFQTNIILDQRCPRLFGFWKEYPTPNGEPPDEVFDYVYVGTYGNGVWRKGLNAHTWSNYSDGLGDLFIKDLFIKDGIAVCVGEDGDAYIRKESDLSWAVLHYGPLVGEDEITYTEIELKVIACSIGDSTAVLGVNYSPDWLEYEEELKISFVVCVDYTSLEVKFSDQVIYTIDVEGEPIDVWNVNIHDLEVMGSDVILSTDGYAESYAYKRDHKYPNHGKRERNKGHWGQELDAVNTLTINGQQEFDGDTLSFNSDSSIITDADDNNIFYGFRKEYFFVGNLGSGSIDIYFWSPPAVWNDLDSGSFGLIRQKSETEFDLIVIVDDTDIYYVGTTYIYHTRYTLGDEVLNPNTTLIKTINGNPHGQAILGDSFMCICPPDSCPDHTACQSAFLYNLDTSSSNVYTNEIVLEEYNPSQPDGGPEPGDPAYPAPIGWVTKYNRNNDSENVVISGDNYITFGHIYTYLTDYHVHPQWVGPIWYGWLLHEDDWELRGSYIKFNKSTDGSVTVEQVINTVFAIYENIASADYTELSIIHSGLDSVSNMVATGGCICQSNFEYPGSPAKTQATVFALDDSFGILNKYTTPWIDDSDEFYDDKLIDVINDDLYDINTIPPEGGMATSSKFFGSKLHKKMSYEGPTPDENILVQSLDLNTCRIPLEGTTPFGTAYYDLDKYAYHTINDDDNDGTIYFKATRTIDDELLLLGIKINGSSYSITKEIESIPTSYISSGMAIFGEWIFLPDDPTMKLVSGFSTGDTSKVVKYSPVLGENKFGVIKDTGYNSSIEINKNAPIEAYHKALPLAIHSTFIYQNFTATEEGWSTITPETPIYDLKTCEIIDSSTFTIEEGEIGDENKWAIFGTKDALKMFPTSLAGESVVVKNFEGNIVNIETTNYNGNPYLFVMLSGLGGSGAGFWQRGQNELVFEQYSSGLPSEHVTIIRVDDRL